MLISPISQTEHDIFETTKGVRAIRIRKVVIPEAANKLDGIVRRLAFAISGHDEEDAAVLGHLIQVFIVIFLGVAYERTKPEFRLSFFG
jgi:hypothetical protein